MSVAAISASGLVKTYSHRHVLRELSFEVTEHEAVSITGTNGSGKTTLLRILATLTSPTSGSFKILGLDSYGDRSLLRRSIGLVMADSYLDPNLTVNENLLFYASLYSLSSPASMIQRWLERFGMSRFGDARADQLSTGETQKISIIRSLLHSPRLCLWDEPAANLDDQGQKMLKDLISELRTTSTVVCTTHHVEKTDSWADRSLVLKEGRLQ